MRKLSIGIATLTLILAIGCNNNRNQNASATSPSTSTVSSSQTAANLSPEDLGTLGAKIKKHPSDAQKLLSDQGLTEDQFEQAVRKVSENPQDSKRYADAYKKAS